MRANIELGRLFGIPIGLHYSWFIIAGLITLSLGARFSATNPDETAGVVWAAALVTALFFFVSLILHELSHALVARRIRLPVRSITLFALGGVAQIESESTSAKGEFWMAIVGPLTSVAIGLGCVSAAHALEASHASYAQASITEGLRNVLVHDLMGHECGVVNAAQSVRSFVDEMLLKSGHDCFIVNREGENIGIITPREVKNIDRDAWPRVPVAEAMRPLHDLPTVTPTTPASEAFSLMNRTATRQLPVMSDDISNVSSHSAR